MLGVCCVYPQTVLKMKAADPSKMPVVEQFTWCQILEEWNLHQHCCENLKSHVISSVSLSSYEALFGAVRQIHKVWIIVLCWIQSRKYFGGCLENAYILFIWVTLAII